MSTPEKPLPRRSLAKLIFVVALVMLCGSAAYEMFAPTVEATDEDSVRLVLENRTVTTERVAVRAFYERRAFRPAWARASSREEVLDVLSRAAEHGLHAEVYAADALREAFASASTPVQRAAADVAMSRMLAAPRRIHTRGPMRWPRPRR